MFWTIAFWQDIAERAVRSAAQGAVLAWGVTSVEQAAVTVPDPAVLLTGALGGAVLAVLWGLAAPPAAVRQVDTGADAEPLPAIEQ